MWLLLSSAFATTLCVPATYDPPGPDCNFPANRADLLKDAVDALRLQPGSHIIRIEQGHEVTENILLDGTVETWDDLRIQGDGTGASWVFPGVFDGTTLSVVNGAVVEIANTTIGVPTGAPSIVAASDLTFEGVAIQRSDGGATTNPAILHSSGMLSLVDTEFGPWETSSDVGHLDIEAGATLTTIDGGRFEGGAAVVAGAIRALSTVSIDGTTFEANTATANAGGGAMLVRDSGDVSVDNGYFTLNESQGDAGLSGGGALHVVAGGSVSLLNTTFDSNTSLGTRGGGAILVDDDPSVLEVGVGTQFLSNSAVGRGGGAIYVERGEIDISDAYFFENFVDDERGGGAIYSERGNLSITGSTFEANRSLTGADGGGALYIRKPTASGSSVFTLSGNAFTDNVSDFQGGAIYVHTDGGSIELVVSNSLFSGNSSAFSGGAIMMRDQTLTSSGNVFLANHATGDATADGGAIAMLSNSFPSTSTDDTFCAQNADRYGGAISLESNTTMVVTRGVFFENIAAVEGGAIQALGDVTVDHGTFVANQGTGAAIFSAGSSSSVRNSFFTAHTTEAVTHSGDDFDYNAWWLNTPSPGINGGASGNDVTADPEFTPPSSGTCDRLGFRPLFGSALSGADDANGDIGALPIPSDPDDQDADGFLASVDDCDDGNSLINPGAVEISCNGIDENCDPSDDEPDVDMDGSTICDLQPDCDDADATVSPLADEVCNGSDDDCDGDIDEADDDLVATTWFVDNDNDGYGDDTDVGQTLCTQPGGTVDNGADCDDSNAGVSPVADEICNGFDDDCDGDVDDDDNDLTNGVAVFDDVDGDGYGGDADPGTLYCIQPSNSVTIQGDCDDSDVSVNPDADETCAPGDEDCDGLVDSDDPDVVGATLYYDDTDSDGYGDDSDMGEAACEPIAGKVANALDCDDQDFDVSPDVEEVCNGVDTDCNGTADDEEALQTVWYADVDSDGFGNPASQQMACPAPAQHVANSGDCNDNFNTDYPGAPELCDGRDNDCNGQVDDQAPMVDWYPDVDMDGFGDGTATPTQSCSQPVGLVQSSNDCNDDDPSINPGVAELCDAEDRNCDGDPILDSADAETLWLDGDGDGFGDPDNDLTACSHPVNYVGNTDDCNDSSPFAWTGADEVCDQVDNDCDGTVDGIEAIDVSMWWPDTDGDLFGAGDPIFACVQPAGHRANDEDCDDTTNAISPDEPEQCDGLDNDCNGAIDDGVQVQNWYADGDGDGFGDPDEVLQNCLRPDGYVSAATDCDDTDPEIGPGALDLCDGIDDNCSGDELDAADTQSLFPDLDGDTWGEIGAVVDACPGSVGLADRVGDCDDLEATVNPDAVEICDGLDNDCDGQVDDGPIDQTQYFADDDGDGYGDLESPVFRCEGLYTDVSLVSTDCDDTDELVNPIAPELCGDGIDNDCDELVDLDDDDLTAVMYWPDADEDGYGDVLAEPVESCEGAPEGTVDNDGDCDDSAPLAWTGAEERCDGVDNDCDGDIDADDADVSPDDVGTWYPDLDGDGFGDMSAEPMQVCDQPDETVANSDDCADDDPDVAPDVEEVCLDDIDNNCNGEVDEQCRRPSGNTGCSCDTPANPAMMTGLLAGLLVMVRRRRAA